MIHIVQCLCPQRHCIMAITYEPGITAVQNGITLDESNAVPYMESIIDECIAHKTMNPWCGLCKAKAETWHCEDGVTRFATLEEALPFIRDAEARQALTRSLFGEGSPIALIPQRSAPEKN